MTYLIAGAAAALFIHLAARATSAAESDNRADAWIERNLRPGR